MALALRKNKPAVSAEDFIGGAPDASKAVASPEPDAFAAIATSPAEPPVAPTKTRRTVGKKNILSVPMSPDVVSRLDAWAADHGMSRAAALTYASSLLLKQA
jgi:hypothetical protein